MALDIKSWLKRQKSSFLFFADKTQKRHNVVVNHVKVQPVRRQSQDIQKWRNALAMAEQEGEQRAPLYDLYSDILLDGRLKALIFQRTSRITNTKLVFRKGGKDVPDVTALAATSFFRKFVQEAVSARFWGHSLLELAWPSPGSGAKGSTALVPRKHVKPRRGIVTKEQWGTEGVSYREPPFSLSCIEVGEPDDLGLILEACPHVIYKRGGFGDWAEYAEVFGMPFRWATYNNEQSRGVLEEALSKAGSAGFVVAPEDAKLQFFSPMPGNGSNDVFRMLIEACNQEMAVTILGNTMTTQEAKHSGYAQSETHLKTQDEVHADDRAYVLCALNESLNRYLDALGYGVAGGEWAFDDGDGLSLAQRIAIDVQVANHVPIGSSYWYERYGIPKPEQGEAPEDDTESPEDTGRQSGKKPKKA